ncbi:MAG TPA: hypothetical protein VN917_03145, partial [Xanthobacteraceae bacterium]|nr:hypothetical protein [Xanthobacteraceae bacterium]
MRIRLDRDRLVRDHERAQASDFPAAQARGRSIERHRVARFDAIAADRFDLGERERRRQQDSALRRAAGKLADGEKKLTRERQGRIDMGAAAVGEQKGAAARGPALGDPIRIRDRQNGAGGSTPIHRPGRGAAGTL